MNPAMLHPLAQKVAWSLIHFLWQGALVGLVAWSVLTLMKQRSPEARYTVACLFLAACAALPILSVFWMELPVPQVNVEAARTLSYRMLKGLRSHLQPLLPWILVVWCLGSLLSALRVFGAWLWLRRMRRGATEVVDAHCQKALKRLKENAGIRRMVRILESVSVQSPFTIGTLRPVILVPLGFFTSLDPLAAEAVLAHELAHIRRLDVLVIGLQAVIETLFFFHPAVRWISRRVNTERELCCDEVAVQACGDAVLFAQTLLHLDQVRGQQPALAPGASGGDLMERIRRLLKVDSGPLRITVPTLCLVLGLSLTATVLVAREEPVKQTLHRVAVFAGSLVHHADQESRGAALGLASLIPEEENTPRTEVKSIPPTEDLVVPARLDRTALSLVSLPESSLPIPESREAAPAIPADLPQAPDLDSSYLGENHGLPELELLKRPVPDSEGRQFKDWTFTLGHATYTLSGKATGFRTGGVLRGFYFLGEGRVEYRSSDVVEFPATRYLLSRHTYIKPQVKEGALHLGTQVTEGLFWFAGASVPELPGSPVAFSDIAFNDRISGLLERDQEPFLHALALRTLGSEAKGYSRVQFRDRKRFWIHTVDEQDAEQLQVNQSRLMDRKFYSPMLLISKQPLAWTHKAPRIPRFALTDMNLDLTVLDQYQGKVRAVQTYTPLREGLQALDLRLPNRYWSHKRLGDTTLRLKVTGVCDAQGKPLPFDHASEGLLVKVPDLKRAVPVTLTFHIEGGMFCREDNYQGEADWLPLPKEEAAKVYTLAFHAQVRKPWRVGTVGAPLRVWTEGDFNHVEARFDKPIRGFQADLARPLLQQQMELYEVDGTSYMDWRDPLEARQESIYEDGNRFLGRGASTMDQLLGARPLKLCYTTGLRYYNDRPMTFFNSAYWGQVAKPWSEEDAWLDEALPHYCYWITHKHWVRNGQDRFEQSMAEWFRTAARAQEAGALATATRILPLDGDPTELTFQKDLLVSKGICILYTLHRELGDEVFAKFLQTCLSVASYQPFTTASMPVILKQLTGKDYEPFFEKYYWGSEVLKQPAKRVPAKD